MFQNKKSEQLQTGMDARWDEAVDLGAQPRQLLKSLLVVERNIKKFRPPLLFSKIIFSRALH